MLASRLANIAVLWKFSVSATLHRQNGDAGAHRRGAPTGVGNDEAAGSKISVKYCSKEEMMDKRFFILIGLLLSLLACNVGMSTPTPTTDLFATLSASTPLGGNPAVTAPAQIATSIFLPTPTPR